MHFVVDAQLPPKLATCLAAWGHTAEHVFERFPQSVSDAEIWAYALKTKGIIVRRTFGGSCLRVETVVCPLFSLFEKFPIWLETI